MSLFGSIQLGNNTLRAADIGLQVDGNNIANVNEVLNQPESISVRNLAVLKGQTLASDINRLASRVGQLRTDTNKQISDAATDVNRLISDVRDLNIKIAETEGGNLAQSAAAG